MGQVTFLAGVLGEVFSNGGRGQSFGEYFGGLQPSWPPLRFSSTAIPLRPVSCYSLPVLKSLTAKGAFSYGMDHASARRD